MLREYVRTEHTANRPRGRLLAQLLLKCIQRKGVNNYVILWLHVDTFLVVLKPSNATKICTNRTYCPSTTVTGFGTTTIKMYTKVCCRWQCHTLSTCWYIFSCVETQHYIQTEHTADRPRWRVLAQLLLKCIQRYAVKDNIIRGHVEYMLIHIYFCWNPAIYTNRTCCQSTKMIYFGTTTIKMYTKVCCLWQCHTLSTCWYTFSCV